MKKYFLVLLVALLLASHLPAQVIRYIVRFKNKGTTSFTFANPSTYLSSRAIARRTNYSIAIDSSDLPVPVTYIDQVKAIPNLTVLNVSRWMNAISIQTTAAAAGTVVTAINALPFVLRTDGIGARTGITAPKFDATEHALHNTGRIKGVQDDYFNYGGNSYSEIHLHNGEFLHNIGLRGQGMRITLLDGGFYNYTSLHAFDSINLNGQVLGTWDFVTRDTSVTEDITHGMQCLSTIAANIPGQFVGKAPKASFYLFRTEDEATEYPIEEFNWVCGAERADSSGTDIISCSLGYTTFDDPAYNHTYADMNGNTTIAAIGADLAAKKGMLVFNAAGNDGQGAWKFIGTPADADSIVAVGAVSATGAIGAFSSYGPSADGQVKPDVASVGVNAIVQNANNTIGTNNGTSFANPNMAGLATCLWQGFPEFNNMRIIRALRQSGSIATTPNDRIGYGIPNMKTAFTDLLKEFATSTASVNSCKVTLNWTTKDAGSMRFEIERKAPGETSYTKIGDLPAQAGAVLANHNYSFENALANVTAGNISYRIRQVVDTATLSFTDVYIDTASVALTAACTTTAIDNPLAETHRLYLMPNPAQGNATLVLDIPDVINKLGIVLYDLKGRMVLRLQQSKAAGKLLVPLPAASLPAGKYIIRLYNNQKPIGTTDLLKL